MTTDKKQEVAKKRVEAITVAENLNELVAQGSAAYIEAASGNILETMSLAVAVAEIEKALTPEIMKPIMSLQGKSLGFKTDKTYPENIVKQAMTEGMIIGIPMAGNCMNIIAESCYVTKEGFTYLINKAQSKGMLSGFKFTVFPPHSREVRGKTSRGNDIIVAMTKVSAEWEQNGQKETFNAEFPCKGDKWSSEDAYMGKAERKAKRLCYERMTGISFRDGEAMETAASGQPGAAPYSSPAADGDGTGVIPQAEQAPEGGELKGLDDMHKPELIKEITSFSGADYYIDIVLDKLPADTTINSAPTSMLREMAKELNQKGGE